MGKGGDGGRGWKEFTQACTSAVTSTKGGTMQVISVEERDATTHGFAPTVTADLATSSSLRKSKPCPLNVISVPPPAEPASGKMPMIAIWDSKVSVLGTAASPNVGTWTRTGCTPGGTLETEHERFVAPSPMSTAATEVQGNPPIVT